MTQVLPSSQYKIVPGELILVQQPEMDGFYHCLFVPEDIVILANPIGCLNDVCINDVCINGCIHLLFSLIKPPDADRFAIFSTHNLLRIRYNASDESLWKVTRHTMFWTKDTWIIPIHRPSPVGHWVLCITLLPCRELRLFDSLAEEQGWSADVEVRMYLLPFCDHTNYVSNRIL